MATKPKAAKKEKPVIEIVEVKQKLVTTKNSHKVQKKTWDTWSLRAKYVFNDVFSAMINNQEFFKHPKQKRMADDMWKTTAWNAAWTAAEAVDNYKGE